LSHPNPSWCIEFVPESHRVILGQKLLAFFLYWTDAAGKVRGQIFVMSSDEIERRFPSATIVQNHDEALKVLS